MFSAVLLVVFRILRWLGVAFEKGSKLRLLKSRDVAPLEIEIGSRSLCRWAAAAGAVALLVLSNETAFPMVGDDPVRSSTLSSGVRLRIVHVVNVFRCR